MRSISKSIWQIGCLLIALSVGMNAQASLIFEFDNNDIAEFDFVGQEAADFGISFGPNTFDMGDVLDILIGSAPGASDISSLFNMGASFDGIQGIGFGQTLDIIPLTDLFYVTIVRQAGSFSVGSMRAYFSDNGNGYLFHGTPIRHSASPVPEPATLLIFLIVFAVLGYQHRRVDRRVNVTAIN